MRYFKYTVIGNLLRYPTCRGHGRHPPNQRGRMRRITQVRHSMRPALLYNIESAAVFQFNRNPLDFKKKSGGFIAKSKRIDIYSFIIITDVHAGKRLISLSPSYLPNPIQVRIIYCMKMRNLSIFLHNHIDLRVHQW